MNLEQLLLTIDPYQCIKIQYGSELLYVGQRRYFPPSTEHSSIKVINILTSNIDDIILPWILICIDRPFM